MGHLCFDWTIPSDHVLEKERQEQAQCTVFPKESCDVGKGCRGRAVSISTLHRDPFLPVTVPARS